MDIRNRYTQINTRLEQEIKQKNIDIKKVLEQYSLGMSMTHIKILYRLNDEQMSFILNNYVSDELRQKRKEGKNLLNNTFYKNSNIMGLSKQQQTIDKLPLSKAIALVEGKNEKGDER